MRLGQPIQWPAREWVPARLGWLIFTTDQVVRRLTRFQRLVFLTEVNELTALLFFSLAIFFLALRQCVWLLVHFRFGFLASWLHGLPL